MTRLERRDLDLYIVAEWDEDQEALGPRRLAIEVAADAPGGIASDVIRRADGHLGDMTNQFNETPTVGAYVVMVRRYVEDRLAALPADGDDYHRGLLDIQADLIGRGHEQSEKALDDLINAPDGRTFQN